MCKTFDSFDNRVDGIDLTSIVDGGGVIANRSSVAMDATNEGMAVSTAKQTESLQTAMDNYAQAMNQAAISKSTGQPVRTPTEQFKGFIAEEYFAQTLKINSLAQGIPDSDLFVATHGAQPDGTILSRTDTEVDISVWVRDSPWKKLMKQSEWQSKIHDNAASYAKDLANKQYERVNFVGGAGQGVNDRISATRGRKTVYSDPGSPKDFAKIADDAKAQATKPYAKRDEKNAELHSVELGRAVRSGAIAGLLYSTVREVVGFLRDSDGMTVERFEEGVQNVLLNTVEGAVRSGTINEAIYLYGRAQGRMVTPGAVEAIPVTVAANVAVDFAKDLYRCFVTGEIDADDLLCNTIESAFSSAVSFGGGWLAEQAVSSTTLLASAEGTAAIGAAIGTPLGPIGMVAGSVVASFVIGHCTRCLIDSAHQDAQKAYCDLIDGINSRIELEGCERLYYFADAMSSLSDFRPSFKNLLPCYNIFSDLKEYSLHKKRMLALDAQLGSLANDLDDRKVAAIREVRRRHETRLVELRADFNDQRAALDQRYREELNAYIANSYAQYASMHTVMNGDIKQLRDELAQKRIEHSYVLDCANFLIHGHPGPFGPGFFRF